MAGWRRCSWLFLPALLLLLPFVLLSLVPLLPLVQCGCAGSSVVDCGCRLPLALVLLLLLLMLLLSPSKPSWGGSPTTSGGSAT